MSKKRGSFVEKYVDKAVLGIVGILSIVLLVMFVIGSPYSVEYQGRKFGPGQIDKHIASEKSGIVMLKAQLDEAPELREYDRDYVADFDAKMGCTISKVDETRYYALPYYGTTAGGAENPRYSKPNIPGVTDVAAEFFRTVAHIPTENVSASLPYEDVATEIGDVDIVSVEGRFDIVSLCDSFETCYAGRTLPAEWRDKGLAEPVFASVELHRAQQNADGTWSDWQVVPKPTVETFKEQLAVPEKVGDIEYGGVDLMKVRFKEFNMQRAVVQPLGYEFASSQTEWLTPLLHKEYEKFAQEEKELKRREARSREISEREKERKARTTGGREGEMGGMMMEGMGPTGGGDRRTASRDRTRTKRTRETTARRPKDERDMDDVYEDFDKLVLEDDVAYDSMKDHLAFWAHDDTVETGGVYKYRLRIGVFNPIAGRDWFRESEDKQFKDDVIFWSHYSDETDPIEVGPKLYFFPVDIAPRQEKSVKVQVGKFFMGKWRNEEFVVRLGEEIGSVVEKIDNGDDDIVDASGYQSNSDDFAKIVDYSTGAIMIDVEDQVSWKGLSMLSEKKFSEVLFTYDGIDVSRVPIKTTYWPKPLQKAFAMVKAGQSDEFQIYTTRGKGRRRRTSPSRKKTAPGTGDPVMDMMDDQMMMMEMEMMKGGR